MLYTFVNLQKIIDTLPCYEKTRLETEGAANVQVCLEDIIELLTPYEKEEFLNKYNDFDDDEIVDYLRQRGYEITNLQNENRFFGR
jgi:hypothetical protein